MYTTHAESADLSPLFLTSCDSLPSAIKLAEDAISDGAAYADVCDGESIVWYKSVRSAWSILHTAPIVGPYELPGLW